MLLFFLWFDEPMFIKGNGRMKLSRIQISWCSGLHGLWCRFCSGDIFCNFVLHASRGLRLSSWFCEAGWMTHEWWCWSWCHPGISCSCFSFADISWLPTSYARCEQITELKKNPTHWTQQPYLYYYNIITLCGVHIVILCRLFLPGIISSEFLT